VVNHLWVVCHVGFFIDFQWFLRQLKLSGKNPMDNSKESKSTAAQQSGQAAITFHNQQMGPEPRSVTVISWDARDAAIPGEIIRAPALPRVNSPYMSESERIRFHAVRAEQLDTGEDDCFDPRHSNGDEFWEQGARGFRQDVRLEACPLESGPAQDDWIRGWIAAELIAFGEFLPECDERAAVVHQDATVVHLTRQPSSRAIQRKDF
jgi:hypothetical protein